MGDPAHTPDGSDERDPVDLLVEQFLQRHRAGESIDIEAYADEHPEQAEQLRELLPTLLMLETVRRDRETSASGSGRVSLPALERLGDFRIERELGRGGMGVVFEAVQESLDRRVALKVLPRASLLTGNQLERFRPQLGGEIDQVVLGYALYIVRRRLGGEGLRWRIPLARHVARLHLTLLDRPDRLAVRAIEHIEEGLFGRLCQGLHDTSLYRDVAKDRCARDVVVPQTVMDELVVPPAFTRLDIERDEGFAEQRVASAEYSHFVAGCQLDGDVHEA